MISCRRQYHCNKNSVQKKRHSVVRPPAIPFSPKRNSHREQSPYCDKSLNITPNKSTDCTQRKNQSSSTFQLWLIWPIRGPTSVVLAQHPKLYHYYNQHLSCFLWAFFLSGDGFKILAVTNNLDLENTNRHTVTHKAQWRGLRVSWHWYMVLLVTRRQRLAVSWYNWGLLALCCVFSWVCNRKPHVHNLSQLGPKYCDVLICRAFSFGKSKTNAIESV